MNCYEHNGSNEGQGSEAGSGTENAVAELHGGSKIACFADHEAQSPEVCIKARGRPVSSKQSELQ